MNEDTLEVFEMKFLADGTVRLRNCTEWYAAEFAELHAQYKPYPIYFFASLTS